MRLVKLSDLSEEERKKALEEQQERLNKNRQEAQNIQSQANNDFNDYIKKHGAYDTNQHTTSLGDIKKAYKNTSSYDTVKSSLNNYYKNNNNTSLWDNVKSLANDLGNNMQNVGLGTKNGINYFRQQLERSTRNNTTNNALNIDNNFLQGQLNKNSNDEKAKILLEKNNSYQNKLKEESQNYQNKLQEKINQNNEKIQNNINNTNNKVLKKTAELAPSIGQMIPDFIPGFGAVYAAGSASGQYYEDAKQRGMNDNEATVYSGIMGLMEGATEQIGIGNIKKAGKGIKSLIKGTGKEALKEGTKEITKTTLKSVLKDYGIGIADNVIQEALIDPIQELTAQTVAGKDKAQWEGIGQKMLQDGINGGLVSAILGGANLGIQSCTGVVEKLHSNQKITGQEIQNAVKDASQQLDTSKMMMDSVEQQVNKYKDYYTGKTLDNNTQNVLNQAQNIINNNTTQNLQQNTTQNQIKQQMQQVTPVQNENVSNFNMTTNNLKDEAINEIKNSKILETSKKEMLEVLNNIDNVTENDLNAIKQTINEVNKSELETNVTYKDSLARKRNYIKYKDDTNTYDSKAVNEVLDSMPSNRNGNRTVKQWLQVANELGKRISDKSNSEIEQIAYKSWFDVQPSKNITKYDNVNKTNVGFQKLTSDDWINTINNAVLQQREQTIHQQNKMSQNRNIEQVNSRTTPITEKQIKSTIKDFNESAKQYNIDFNNEDLQEINQMFDKRGIKAYFDENTFKNNNDAFSVWKPVTDEQGNISRREVVFNPNAKDSNTRVQELAIHELGHDLDLNEVQDMILKDASRKENWESARKSLENTYREAYKNDGINISEENFNKIVDEEATMSILQRELGSQEYVNRLVNQNQSIAKKIYNWVIDKLNKFTGGRNERIFWTDIKNKFETAYNQEFNKNDNTAKFSIAGKKSLENIKNDSYSYSRGINSYNNAINLAKQNIDNEQIRQKTGWFQDKNGDWKYEFSDKDMSLKNIKIQKDKIYKLGDILKHDTLFTLYPEVENYKVEINDNIKANASFDRRNNTITINSKLIKNNKSLEGTLIHEIQHAIQNIENFERGTSTKGSKLKYYNSLGEIEATETKGRFLKEKYQNKNMFPIAPESSKANPQHKDLNKYLKNRNLLDKVKDSMYNYFNKRGVNNYDVSEEIVEKDRTQNNSLVDERKRLESENNSGSFNLPKLKEGYTRLYRGLENEYDANYDKSKLDNSNGYESWTDDYELAKAYGDNVYYIDVPSSEVKNSIIDEDSQSETYGDRNLLYKNDKPVGIKGKSGNEYMLYTDHDNYGNIKYNKIDNNNSTQDNQGRTLTKEQQEFFKDSKVRDEDGNLLEVYHGTKTNGINIFNYAPNRQTGTDYGKAYYFTTDYIKAQGYQYDINKDPKFIEYDKIGKEYLDKVFATSDENEKKKVVQEWADWEKENSVTKLLYDENFTPERLPDGETKKLYLNIKKPYIADAKGQYYFKVYDKYFKEARANGNDGIIVKNVIDVAMGKHRPIDVYIAFNENQIKNVDNTNPTTNPDIRYSLPTKEWQQFIEYNYQKQGTGKNLKEYKLPTKEDVKTKLNLPTKENINQPTQGEKIDWNEIERPEGKIRKHYRSIIESSNTTKEAKAIAKELMGTDTYVPETNKGQLAQADYRINNSSPEAELKSLMNRTIQGEKISSVDIAVGERLIQYYSKIGDKANLQDAIQTTAMAGTSAGQTVQALAMLNHQTPEGQATWIQRSVDKMNNELAKRKGGTITKDEEGNIKVVNKKGQDITDKVDLFDLTPDMIDKIVSSKNKTEMYDNIDQVYEDLGQQVPLSTMEKIDSWRYFSMLANPKTHIRNMVGNVAMGKTQSLKDKLAGGIEDIVSTFNKDMERTKTLKQADAKTKEFAKNDVLNPDVQSMMELNENKYNPQSRLQNARKTFKNDALENTLGRLFNWNDKLLEAEDALGLKSAYKKALTDYLTANKIDVDNITDKQLSKARNYAVEQAKEATFHQANAIATAINQFSKKNGLTKGFTDAVLPFVKTPLNVAKAGVEYNPTGLLKTITYDTVKLRKGEITVNKYIDNLSKGLTGTGIAVLGYALADAGILKASGGDDDKKEKYDEALGKQTYSITIGDRTYSLDWLAPVGIPLFVGAEAKAIKDSNKEEKSSTSSDDDKRFNKAVSSLENLANAMANSMSPMSEMSMISGLTSALKSYEQDSTKMLGTIGTNAVKSYVNQFVPTLLGQVARTTDDYERSTTSTKSGVLSKAIDQTKLQVMSKIPGLRQKLPTKADIWGNEQKSEPNLPLRIVNNFVNPATVKNIDTSKVDEELDNLYNRIGESSILPSTIEKTYTINSQTYRMTNEEYAKYKKNYGQTSYKLLDDLINSNDYNKLSDEQKQKAIENIYSYAKEANKVDYAKNNNETVKTSTLYDTLEELKQKGGNQSSYLNYIAKTKDITGEDSSKKKIEVLANSNYTDKTKEIIYKNTEGSKDKKIIVVDKLGLPINEYLKYKSQKFESDKDEDGETVKGSKNQKVYNYLNNIPDEDLSQDYKKIICKISGINSYDKDIVNMINNNKKLTVNERTEILTNIGFKIDKQGRIQTSSVLPLVKYVK